jgi:hypothetical protein
MEEQQQPQPTKCKRPGCYNPPAIHKGQVYCSRQCAPYGYLSAPEKSPYAKRPRKNILGAHKAKMEILAREGKTRAEAAAIMGLAMNTFKVYCKKFDVTFCDQKKPKFQYVRKPKRRLI